MNFRLRRRAATLTTVALLTLGGVALATESASAYTTEWLPNTGHGVGVYTQPYSWSQKGPSDLWSSNFDGILANCWTMGEDVAGHGNVWYRVDGVSYAAGTGGTLWGTWYVYGAYADNFALFYNHEIPKC
ncbi:hypothetical protein ABT095_37645 [Kitasatospora sp. NPDC002227]|uniref:hypothetical protein n=1 Tax=Kitasatospora sp. NPDC002227 TaxID=3154773 RepID=UPI0033283B93